mmetsp:Transcript_6078/g.19552  ORF Transcript_6078/g.19552 Transcript_6078/m.19552 type:complete len:237 (+) Transcript_6078:1186-1896(+)
MQSLCRSARDVVSTRMSFVVTSRSPCAVALLSPLWASPAFALAMSLLANRMLSSSDCTAISKLCFAAVSFFLASSSCDSAFSKRLSRVEMMSLLWPSYTAAAGAPRLASAESSSERCAACTSAVSLAPSLELIAEAWTRMLNASVTLAASFSCIMDAPPFCISFSRMPTARFSMSMTSVSSFSSALKSDDSLARTSLAAFSSPSSEATLPASSSIFALREPARAVSLAMVASSSAA